jgi:hypothetical protein
MRYPKFIAIFLPILYFLNVFFKSWEYCWIFEFFTSWFVGGSIIYLWNYDNRFIVIFIKRELREPPKE